MCTRYTRHSNNMEFSMILDWMWMRKSIQTPKAIHISRYWLSMNHRTNRYTYYLGCTTCNKTIPNFLQCTITIVIWTCIQQSKHFTSIVNDVSNHTRVTIKWTASKNEDLTEWLKSPSIQIFYWKIFFRNVHYYKYINEWTHRW